jgi:hypothetical protein
LTRAEDKWGYQYHQTSKQNPLKKLHRKPNPRVIGLSSCKDPLQETKPTAQAKNGRYHGRWRRNGNPYGHHPQSQQKKERKWKHTSLDVRNRILKREKCENGALEGYAGDTTIQAQPTYCIVNDPSLWLIPSHAKPKFIPNSYPLPKHNFLPTGSASDTSSSPFTPKCPTAATYSAFPHLEQPEYAFTSALSTLSSNDTAARVPATEQQSPERSIQTPLQSPPGQRAKEKLKSRKSRNISKWRTTRFKKQMDAQHAIPLCQNSYHVSQWYHHNYDFCVNPNNTLQKIFNDTIKNNPNYTLN